MDRSLVMGSKSSAHICAKMTTALNDIFVRRGNASVCYLDDYCGLDLPHKAMSAYLELGEILDNAGFEQATDKCVPPTTEITQVVEALDTWLLKKKASKNRLLDTQKTIIQI